MAALTRHKEIATSDAMKTSGSDAPKSSQEVRDDVADGDGLAGILGGVEDLEVPLQVLVDVEDRGHIATAVAVVWGRPDRHQVAVLEPVLEAIHHELMGASHQFEVVDVIELSGNLGSEEPASASG